MGHGIPIRSCQLSHFWGGKKKRYLFELKLVSFLIGTVSSELEFYSEQLFIIAKRLETFSLLTKFKEL